MTIVEAIRHLTLPIRDEASNIAQQFEQAEARGAAAQERVKRASTEITRQRAFENERKRSLNKTSEKVEEAQRILEDLDRKRQEALETFIRCQEEHKAIGQSLTEAQRATEAALNEIRKEQKTQQDAELLIVRLRAERCNKEADLRRALLRALDAHLKEQGEHFQGAFSTQEQRLKAMQDFEAFKRARHTDPDIARLCDQRDELLRFLNSAMVPGVKGMLQTSLEKIEDELSTRFPSALQVPEMPRMNNQIEEMIFYCDQEGKAIFLLPVQGTDWDAIECQETANRTSNTMRLVWDMIKELKLRTEDGDFTTMKGRPVFASRFDLEEVAILQGFNVKSEGLEVIRFVFSTVPTELQEALSHEDQDV